MEQAARAEDLDRTRLEKEREMFAEWQDQEGEVSRFSLSVYKQENDVLCGRYSGIMVCYVMQDVAFLKLKLKDTSYIDMCIQRAIVCIPKQDN